MNPRTLISLAQAHLPQDVNLLLSHLTFSKPVLTDAPKIIELVKICEPLELNSPYLYMLLCEHFRATCLIVKAQDEVAGFVSCYCPPDKPDVLFVWQIAVHPSWRRKGLGSAMLRYTLDHHAASCTRFLEASVTPLNVASRHLFASLARSLGAPHEEKLWFAGTLFDEAGHQDETLHRIGPL